MDFNKHMQGRTFANASLQIVFVPVIEEHFSIRANLRAGRKRVFIIWMSTRNYNPIIRILMRNMVSMT